LPSLDSMFEGYAKTVVKYRKPILAAWIVFAVVMGPFALESTRIVSYSINIPTSNNQSQVAENIVSTEFPSYQQPDNTYYVILQGENVLTPTFYHNYLRLNQSLFSSLAFDDLTNITSIYSLEYSLLDRLANNIPGAFSNASTLVNDTSSGLSQVRENLSATDSAVHQVFVDASNAASNMSALIGQLNKTSVAEYQLYDRVNETAQLLFGVPAGYLSVWSAVYGSPYGSSMTTQMIDSTANSSYVEKTGDFGGSNQSQSYYSLFYRNWYSETKNSMSPYYVYSNLEKIGEIAINSTVPQFIATENLNQMQAGFLQFVAQSLNLTDFGSKSSISSLTMKLFTMNLPANQSQLAYQVFALGRNPSQQQLINVAQSVLSTQLSPSQLDFTLGAYYASLNDTLAQYSINYFVNDAMSTDPSLSSLLSSKYNLTLNQFVTDAFNIGVPDNSSLLDLYQNEIITEAISSNDTVTRALQQDFNLSVQQFVFRVSNASSGGALALKVYSERITATSIQTQVAKLFYLGYNGNEVYRLVQAIENGTLYPEGAANDLLSGMFGWNGSIEQLPVYPGTGLLNQFVSPSHNTTIAILQFSSPPSQSTQKLFESIVDGANSTGFQTHYTSTSILDNDVQAVITDSERIALPFGIIIAIIVTGIFFLSPVAALIPTLMFGVALEVGFGLVDLIIGRLQGQTLSYISPIIIAVLGLGLASDYAVLMLNRFRQELRGDKEQAGRTTVRWAGEAVFTSGLTVVMSYLALSLSGIPLFSDVGSANVIVVSVILASSLSLLPVLMASSGSKIFWPGHSLSFKPSRLSGLTRASMKKPKVVVGVLVLITLGAAFLSVNLPVNVNFLSLAPNTPGKVGLDQITNNFGGSTLLPEYVVVRLPAPLSIGNDTYNQTSFNFLAMVYSVIRNQTGVSTVYGPVSPYNSTIPVATINSLPYDQRSVYAQAISPYLTKDNSTAYFKVIFSGDPFSNTVLSEATQLGANLQKLDTSGYQILLGGISTDSAGVLQYVFSILPKIIIVLVAAIFFVLLLQLRSVFTPLRLIATILSSVTWTLALVWIIFYDLSGLSIYIFAPLFLVTTMLGVGMDYDIFLITRVREEVMKGYSDEDAILRTAQTTAGVITVLGVILGSVFFGLVLSQVKLLQQIGLTLTFGVLMDTFVVWLMFVPAIMVLAKRLNWWPGNPRRNGVRKPDDAHQGQ
jgi:RND superfamily putative drug exporter